MSISKTSTNNIASVREDKFGWFKNLTNQSCSTQKKMTNIFTDLKKQVIAINRTRKVLLFSEYIKN